MLSSSLCWWSRPGSLVGATGVDLVGFVVVSLFEAAVEKSTIGASVEKSPNGASVEKSSIRGCRAAGPVASSEFGVAASSEADDASVDWRCGPLAGTNRGGKVVLSWSLVVVLLTGEEVGLPPKKEKKESKKLTAWW